MQIPVDIRRLHRSDFDVPRVKKCQKLASFRNAVGRSNRSIPFSFQILVEL
jgi:hypothetical protein